MTKVNLAIPAAISNHRCAVCPMLRRCQNERLWLDVLPCEAQLDFEVGVEYEVDSLPTLGRMPVVARVNVEAVG